jgi:quercetin dioxygenase-like cupin family protein
MKAMAMRRASSAEIFDLGPLGSGLKDARTTAIVKTETFEAVRLIVHAGVEIKTHKVDGPITLHCLEGLAMLRLPDTARELSDGQWLYLEGKVPHSIKGIEDTSLLLTILFLPCPDTEKSETRSEQTSLD